MGVASVLAEVVGVRPSAECGSDVESQAEAGRPAGLSRGCSSFLPPRHPRSTQASLQATSAPATSYLRPPEPPAREGWNQRPAPSLGAPTPAAFQPSPCRGVGLSSPLPPSSACLPGLPSPTPLPPVGSGDTACTLPPPCSWLCMNSLSSAPPGTTLCLSFPSTEEEELWLLWSLQLVLESCLAHGTWELPWLL